MATQMVRKTFVGASPLAGAFRKDIWGETFRIFNGIENTATGITPIQDSVYDYGRALTAESYIYRAVDVRGKAIGQVPLRCYELDSEGKRAKAVDHDALAVLESTNPIGYVDGAANLTRYTLGALDLWGRNAWRLAFNSTHKVPTEIYWVVPATFKPKRAEPGQGYFAGIEQIVASRDAGSGSKLEPVPADELVYMTTPNFSNPIEGTSKIKVLRTAINLRMMSVQSNKEFFENSQRPDIVVTGDWDNDDDTIEDLRRAWRSAFQGERNRSPLFLGQGNGAHLLTVSPKDAEWIQQQRLSGEEIFAIFGVPVTFLNNFEHATYENVKAMRQMLYTETMIPEGDDLAALLTRRFLNRFWAPAPRAISGKASATRRLVLGFDWTEVEGLAEDIQRIWERVTAMWQRIDEMVAKHTMTPNQARPLYAAMANQIGLDPASFQGDVPLGDTFLAPYTEVPVEQLSIQELINVMAARSGKNPELIENVPGAEHAGDNADTIGEEAAAAAVAAAVPPSPAAGTPNQQPTADPAQPGDQEAAKAESVARLRSHLGNLRMEVQRRARKDGEPYDRDRERLTFRGYMDPTVADAFEAALHYDLSAAGGDRAAIAHVFRVTSNQLPLLVSAEGASETAKARVVEERVVLGPGVRVYPE